MTISPPGAAPAASLGRRVGAFAIDLGVAYGLAGVLIGIAAGIVLGVGPAWERETLAMMILLSYLVIGLALFAWWLVYSAMQGGRGSVGQRILGLHLQDADGTASIGFWRAVWRNIVFSLAASIVVGYFTPLFDGSGRRQGWHDMAARAVVVDVRKADASSSAVAPAVVATANPYLPPPAGAAPLPPVPPLPPAPPVPQAGFRPVAESTPPTTRPAAPVATGGVIDTVPWVTGDPVGAAVARAPQPADRFPSVTMPFPAATTTEPLGAAAMAAPAAPPAPPVAPPPLLVAAPVAPPAAPPVAAPAAPPVAAPAAPPVAAPAVGAAAAASAVLATDEDLDSTRIAVPPPAQRAALYDEAPVIAVLTWDDGSRMAVYGRTLYGRNPANEDGAVAIAVRDETLSLSKTHFEVGGDASGAWIVDRHSTNGTTLVRDGGRIPLVPGVRTPLRQGDGLEFGDRRVTVGSA